MESNTFLKALEWRYATKRMTGEKLPDDKLQKILDAIHLAPSSLGFTPYNVLVISDPVLKATLAPHCYNQPQITESSVLLIFTAWTEFNEGQVEKYIHHIADTRKVTVESLQGFAANIKGKINNSPQKDLQLWAEKQTYIALGIGLTAAAFEKVDSTPMEGFSPAGVNEALGLNDQHLHAVCILALGFRDEEKDFLSKAKKVRRRKEELFIRK